VLQWKKSPLLLERTFLLAGRFSPLAGLKRSESVLKAPTLE
jgi:hypothetical protein